MSLPGLSGSIGERPGSEILTSTVTWSLNSFKVHHSPDFILTDVEDTAPGEQSDCERLGVNGLWGCNDWFKDA